MAQEGDVLSTFVRQLKVICLRLKDPCLIGIAFVFNSGEIEAEGVGEVGVIDELDGFCRAFVDRLPCG